VPLAMMRKLASRYGVSVERAEAAWRACSDAIKPVSDGKKGGRPGYGVVVNCVKRKLAKK